MLWRDLGINSGEPLKNTKEKNRGGGLGQFGSIMIVCCGENSFWSRFQELNGYVGTGLEPGNRCRTRYWYKTG